MCIRERVDSALDTYLARRGVCRDFAHLVITFLRAYNVPARLVSVYAPGLSPMDFHAVVEAAYDGQWWVLDATGLAPRQPMVRIATGADTSDTAFLTVTRGLVALHDIQVTATIAGDLPVDGRAHRVLGDVAHALQERRLEDQRVARHHLPLEAGVVDAGGAVSGGGAASAGEAAAGGAPTASDAGMDGAAGQPEGVGGAAGEAVAAEPGAAGEGGGAAPTAPVRMPEARTAPGPAAAARGGAVAGGAGGAARAARELPSADQNTADARGAVTEPVAETAARAREELAAELGERPAPSPEIVELVQRIRDAIRNNRPEDEDQLLATDPTQEAQSAGETVSGTVDGQVSEASGEYDACLLYTSPSPRDRTRYRMPSSA